MGVELQVWMVDDVVGEGCFAHIWRFVSLLVLVRTYAVGLGI